MADTLGLSLALRPALWRARWLGGGEFGEAIMGSGLAMMHPHPISPYI
ncbi:MAG TPA: hypothetical protein VJ044_12710 [Candidatus Hodarchaeales archaeon]|nr:hypothetical protein [Candidatus Hodarchaeales archaeon]